MNQPIELQSLRDLSQYFLLQNNPKFHGRKKLYLYVFKKSGDFKARIGNRDFLYHVDAGTIHIGNPYRIQIKNRDNVFYEPNEKLGWKFYRSDQEMYWGLDPHVKQDIGDSVVVEYAVYYELIPGATKFEDKRQIDMMYVSPILFEEVSVFDIGDIGYELAVITPEQAAEKYFGVSDFRQFFSNYAAVNKQMSLKNHPHVSREYEHADDLRSQVGLPRIAPKGIPLTGMHPVNPSSFHEYVNAGKQLFSGKHQIDPVLRPSKTASLLSGVAGGLMLGYGRPFSAMATLSLPYLSNIHSRIREQQELNAQQQKKTVALSGEEREKLLAKGAMASELTRRLTTDPTQFISIHNHVHQKPTHSRIHWSNTKRGGRKNRRTIKKNI